MKTVKPKSATAYQACAGFGQGSAAAGGVLVDVAGGAATAIVETSLMLNTPLSRC